MCSSSYFSHFLLFLGAKLLELARKGRVEWAVDAWRTGTQRAWDGFGGVLDVQFWDT